ncbi:Crp/Fnr family transcriptional regulator [Rhizosphaericola mali]|uniref:Crp/Fnr family transcriptional regulator n=1 Tax=Rhizosphaericola mali TaxID=2545455 RepID=A0A5P2G500_9BACT|nr:Crp/Fnr family transcriptional regulator [Rhizosphaericola mali]QES90267.1 Crp/Fnr family transcriptional regulator [Rhizosphaericola mali]
MLKYLSLLKETPILSDMPIEIIKTFLENSKLIELKKKRILYLEGSTDDNISFLAKGAIRGYSMHNNKEIVDLFYTDQSFIANVDFIFLNLPSRLTVESITPCVLFSFPKKFVFDMQNCNEKIRYKIYEILVTYIRIHDDRVKLLTTYPIAIKSYLKFKERFGFYVEKFPNKDIASYLGITPEALTRIKKSLSE